MRSGMKITVVLAVWLASSSCVRAGICDAWPNAIEADMRVTESHLTAAAVRKAENFLRKHSEAGDDDYQFGRLNSKKIIEGYRRKQAAERGGEVEVSAFCDWLVTKGFWYD